MTQSVASFLAWPWNPAFLRVTFGGILIFKGAGMTGAAKDGSFFMVKKGGPSFTWEKGPDGTMTRNATNDRSFTATLRIMQGAQMNDLMSAILAADELASQTVGGSGIGELVVADLWGTTKFSASLASLTEWPDLDFQATAQPREWVWGGLRDLISVGGNIPLTPVL